MKLALIGSGLIGGTLGRRWAAAGHLTMFGSRDPQSARMKELLELAGRNARAGSVEEAVAFGEVIVLAVPGTEIERVLEEAGDLGDKILINCTNRFDGRSAGEEVIRSARNARVVRAFNTVAWEVIANPQYGPTNATIFVSGDDAGAKDVVAGLCRDIGFDPVDAGASSDSHRIESVMGMLWEVLSPKFGRDYALRVVRRDT